jgi:hypothetical protein
MDIETFSAHLKIDKQLDEELVVHSDVLFRISEQVNQWKEAHAKAIDTFKQAEAEAFAAQKQLVDGSTGKPLSDTRAEMGARIDPFRVKAHVLMANAKAQLDRWESLYEAWKTKGYNMNTLAAIYATGNFSVGLPNRAGNPKHDYTKDAPSPRRRAST